MTVHRSFGVASDLPGIVKTDEVVDADGVEQTQLTLKTLQPPFKVLLAMSWPVVVRMTPQLTGIAETIRRHTGDDFCGAVFV